SGCPSAQIQGEVLYNGQPASQFDLQRTAAYVDQVGAESSTASVPNIPTVREAGGPDMDLQGWFGLFGPAGLPAEVVGKLEQASRTVIADPEIQKKFLALGISPVMLDTAAFRARIETDYRLITEIITKAKLTID
ncbi:MAG: Bug family tripartite tricarboxylate transporter substrate binding protein, partial [Burkholderiales bacterium]